MVDQNQTKSTSDIICTLVKSQVDLLARLLDNQKHILANQRSGATDRLDTATVERAFQQRQIDQMAEAITGLVTRVDTLTRLTEEQHSWSMPFWIRWQRRRNARKKWAER